MLTGIQQSSQPLEKSQFSSLRLQFGQRKHRFYQEPPSLPPQTTMCQTGVGATALNIKFIVLFSHSEPNHLSQWGTAEGRIFTVPACLPTAVPS